MNPFRNEPDRAEWTTRAGLKAVVQKLPRGDRAYGYVQAPPHLGLPDEDATVPLPGDVFEDGFGWARATPGEPSSRKDDLSWVGFHSTQDLGSVQNQCEALARILTCRLLKEEGS